MISRKFRLFLFVMPTPIKGNGWICQHQWDQEQQKSFHVVILLMTLVLLLVLRPGTLMRVLPIDVGVTADYQLLLDVRAINR